jgi:hypothetical protein
MRPARACRSTTDKLTVFAGAAFESSTATRAPTPRIKAVTGTHQYDFHASRSVVGDRSASHISFSEVGSFSSAWSFSGAFTGSTVAYGAVCARARCIYSLEA